LGSGQSQKQKGDTGKAVLILVLAGLPEFNGFIWFYLKLRP
jgi:hypothetical protein